MTTAKILNEEQITMTELASELARIRKRDEELNFRAQRTEEYLQAVSPLKKKDADELKGALEGLGIQRLKPEHVTKIIDLQPRSLEELKTVMAAYIVTLSADNLKKILDTINATLG